VSNVLSEYREYATAILKRRYWRTLAVVEWEQSAVTFSAHIVAVDVMMFWTAE